MKPTDAFWELAGWALFAAVLLLGFALIGWLSPAHGLDTNPFADDATLSYERADGSFWFNSLPYVADAASARRPALMGNFNWNATTAGLGDEELPEYLDIEGTIASHITVPAVGTIPDWQTVYALPPIGVQIEALEDWFPVGEGHAVEVPNHVEMIFQALRVAAARVGARLKIQHVHLMEAGWEDNAPENGHAAVETRNKWTSVLVMNHPVMHVLRLSHRVKGGMAQTVGPCPAQLAISRAPYRLNMNGEPKGVLYTIAQELYHMEFGLAHSQCYQRSDQPGEPVDRCYEIGCWDGLSECPPQDAFSFMSYCYYCAGLYIPSAPAWYGMPRLRFGPPRGYLEREVRRKLLDYAVSCPLEAVGTMPLIPRDSDRDEVFDDRDNCPFDSNPAQADADVDGQGDACQACAVGATHGAAWPLLVPLLVWWWRR